MSTKKIHLKDNQTNILHPETETDIVKISDFTLSSTGNFLSISESGTIEDSGKSENDFATAEQGTKADTAIQGIKQNGTALVPVNGVVDIPLEIESASARTLSPNSNATAEITDKELIIGVPKGRDAINPFKGWYNSSNDFPQTGQNGDYLYLIGANASVPAAIYAWNGSNWADTGRTADTSNVQTFASGEEVNDVRIDDTHLANAVADDDTNAPIMAKGSDVQLLKQSMRGVSLEEEKVELVLSGEGQNVFDGYIDGSTGSWHQTGSSNYYIIVPVNGYERVRWLAREVSSANTQFVGYAFGYFDGEVDASLTHFNPTLCGIYPNVGTSQAVEYIRDIQDEATHAVITIWISNNSPVTLDNFYCYLESGNTVKDDISKVESSIGHTTFEEVKVTDFVEYHGYLVVNQSYSPYISSISRESEYYMYTIIDVKDAKKVRFLGGNISNETSLGYAFFDETNFDQTASSSNADGGFLIDNTGYIRFARYDITDANPKEYIADVPEGAKYMKLSTRINSDEGFVIDENNFYCYLQYGDNVENKIDEKVSIDETHTLWTYQKNLININDYTNGTWLSGEYTMTYPFALLSNKLHLVDGETYTVSNVPVVFDTPENAYFHIFRFTTEGKYINVYSVPAKKTNGNTSGYAIGQSTFMYKKWVYTPTEEDENNPDFVPDEEGYQLIRLRYMATPSNGNLYNAWKDAQLEVGKEATTVVPYHSVRNYSVLKLPKNMAYKEIGACYPKTVYNLEDGLPFEENGEPIAENVGNSTNWTLLRWDVTGLTHVSVSGAVPDGYYTWYLYYWADENMCKIGTENYHTTSNASSWNWNNVLFSVPVEAKYLYATAHNKKLGSYEAYGITPYSEQGLINYVNDTSLNLITNNSRQNVINILAIGNSYSQDSLAYVPFLAQNYGITVNLAILMQSSSSISMHLNAFKNESANYLYQYCYNKDYRWHSVGSTNHYTIQSVLDKRAWDIIMINITYDWNKNGKWESDDNNERELVYKQSTREKFNELICLILDYIDYPTKIVGLNTYVHPSVVNTHTSPDTPNYFSGDITYGIQDLVAYGDNKKIYQSLQQNNKNKLPFALNSYFWKITWAVWNDKINYQKNDVVTYDNTYYRCKVSGTNHLPYGVNEYYWVVTEETAETAWDSTTNYEIGALVKYDGQEYECKVAGSGHIPYGINEYYWTETREQWRNSTEYVSGDIVLYNNGQAEASYKCLTKGTDHSPYGVNEYYWTETQELTETVWNSTTDYNIGDVVEYDGQNYECLKKGENHIPYGVNEYYWWLVSNWNNTTEYVKGNVVIYDNVYYECKVAGSHSEPYGVNEYYWTQFYKLWNNETTYGNKNVIYYNDTLYLSLQSNNQGHSPYGVNEYYWTETQELTETVWNSTTDYNIGDVVEYDGQNYECNVAGSGHIPYGVNEYYWRTYEWNSNYVYNYEDYVIYSSDNTYDYKVYVNRIIDPDPNNPQPNDETNMGYIPYGVNQYYWEQTDKETEEVWDSTTNYNIGDVVIYNESKYKCLVAGRGHVPYGVNEHYWLLFNRPYTQEQMEQIWSDVRTDPNDTSHINGKVATCHMVEEYTLCDGIIPIYTAIKNAYTVEEIRLIGSYLDEVSNTTGFGWLTAQDGFHLQEGLPCQLAAYVVVLYILKLMGMEYNSILGDDTMANWTWLSDKVIPGQQGFTCGFNNNDEENRRNLKFIQRCALMAMKKPYEITDMNEYFPPYYNDTTPPSNNHKH